MPVAERLAVRPRYGRDAVVDGWLSAWCGGGAGCASDDGLFVVIADLQPVAGRIDIKATDVQMPNKTGKTVLLRPIAIDEPTPIRWIKVPGTLDARASRSEPPWTEAPILRPVRVSAHAKMG